MFSARQKSLLPGKWCRSLGFKSFLDALDPNLLDLD
jgi:hypothetical protein